MMKNVASKSNLALSLSKHSKCITRNSNSNTDLWKLISSFRIEEKEDGDNDGLGDKGLESLENLKV